jgi:predicted phage gp36 major capsid-like protein
MNIDILYVILKKYWKPLAIILLVVFLLWKAYSAGEESKNSEWQGKWLLRDLADSTATLHQEVANRAEEQRRQRAADEEQKRANEELAKVQADADAAQRAGDRLQQQLTEVQRQLARSETGRLSAVAAASAAKAQAGILLAQLLGEADDLAGEFAKEADERYVAGSTCERTYDKVTKQ